MHFFPATSPDFDYILMMYSDEWEDGTCVRSSGLQREMLDIDIEWLQKIPVDQFATLVLEIASQVLVTSGTEEDVARLKESVAREVQASKTLSDE